VAKRAYTSGEAARLCGLSLSTLKRWIRRGALRTYRTPGGDIRVPHEHLRDFMREFDLPVHRLTEDEPRVLLRVSDAGLRRTLMREIRAQVPHAVLEAAEADLDLGFSLASFQPWVVILEAKPDAQALVPVCQRIQRFLAPAPVRIGAVNAQAGAGGCDGGPDLALEEQPDSEEVRLFVDQLVGAVLAEPYEDSSRRRSA